MAINTTLTLSITGIGNNVSQSVAIACSGTADVNETIADNTTDGAITFALDISATKVIYMVSDQAITVKTNSSSTPQETINLAANVPLLYAPTLLGSAAPFADDVTGLFVTNESGAAATLIIKAGTDVTP